MTFVFNPTVHRNGANYPLPRPILSVRVRDLWDYTQFKVPLVDGEFTTGQSRRGTEIAITGQFGTRNGELTATEQAMFAEIEGLRDALHVGSADERYTFFLYFDQATGTYRRFDDCTTVRFECDLSDPHLFSYSLVIHADIPEIRDGIPVP